MGPSEDPPDTREPAHEYELEPDVDEMPESTAGFVQSPAAEPLSPNDHRESDIDDRPDATAESTTAAVGFDALRSVCVAHTNELRASLGIAPVEPADLGECSDAGARLDAESGKTHASAGDCVGMGPQNSCPAWDISFFASDEEALMACLDMMWAEGEPPVSRIECADDYLGCFSKHGHYLNMSNPGNTRMSCGFFRMPDGELWMNQDFGR